MSDSTFNLSTNEQHVTGKRKEEDITVAAQAAIAHREQEVLIAIVAVARKTLYEARVCSPLLRRKRRSSPIIWNSNSLLPKGS
jgi:hypothetical protein